MVTYLSDRFKHVLVSCWVALVLTVLWVGPISIVSDALLFSLVSVLVSIMILSVYQTKMLDVYEETVSHFTHSNDEVSGDTAYFAKEIVLSRKRPLVTVLFDTGSIAQEAAELARGCLDGRDLEGYQLIFLGASSFQTPSSGMREDRVMRSEGRDSPDQIYHGALEQVASKSARVGRFVNLLELDEFIDRTPTIRARFLSWLESQLSQMKRNPNYVVIDSKRSPKWGALGAMIVSADHLIQFSHPAGAALSIRDRRIVKALIRSSIEEVERSNPRNRQGYIKELGNARSELSTYSLENIDAFSGRIEAYRNALKEAPRRLA